MENIVVDQKHDLTTTRLGFCCEDNSFFEVLFSISIFSYCFTGDERDMIYFLKRKKINNRLPNID